MAPVERILRGDLELITAAADNLAAQLAGPDQLAKSLGVTVPDDWPPEGNDRPVISHFIQLVSGDPNGLGWYYWYVICHYPRSTQRRLAGSCGFTGRPDRDGTAEIGYAIVPSCQGRGYATAAVGILVEWAFRHADVQRIVAETACDNLASQRVLGKHGFSRVGCDCLFARFERTRRPGE